MQIEHKIWNDYISKGLIILPLHCPKCNKKVSLNEYDSTINTYIGRCCNPKCRKIIYLRIYTIFNLASKTLISIINI